MKIKVWGYPKCSTCRNAEKFLKAKGLDYESVDITEKPPSQSDLKKMLGHLDGQLGKLFNTSGQVYRSMKLKEKLPKLSQAEAIKLLSQNGKLIKRPFVLTDKGGTVGFKQDVWKKLL